MKKMMSISERTANVKRAVFFAQSSIPRFVIQETGMSAYAALQGIFPALLASLAFVTLTTAVGAGSGAFMGSFAAGIGAVPMGIAGGSVGFKAGLWILNIVGLAFLVEYMGGSLWEAVRHIEDGIKQAWGPKSQYDWVNDGNVFDASDKIAHGVAILIRCVLEGIVLYLTVKGVSKLPEVVANLKRSKFGEGFAVWVEQNYQQMLSNPKLNRRVGTGAAAAKKPIKVLDHSNIQEQPRSGNVKESKLTNSKQINKSDLESWYQKQNDVFKDPDYMASHARGTDFSKPVYQKTLPEGTEIVQYQGTRGAGMYASYPGTSADALAINGERTLVTYKTTAPLEVIESTAAKFPAGQVPNVGGTGGGQQLILPSGWQNAVKIIP